MGGSKGAKNGRLTRLSGKNHANDIGMTQFDLFEQLRAIHFGHTHIRDHDVERFLVQHLERSLGIVDEVHVPLTAHAMQSTPQTIENIGGVIDKEQTFGH